MTDELKKQLTERFRARSSRHGLQVHGSGRATRDSVLAAFTRVQSQFEGAASQFDYMYTDSIGLVTIGMGNLIDDKSGMNGYGPALDLPFVLKSDGSRASQAEIIQDWQTVKAAHTATGSYDAPHDAQITQLKLTQQALTDLSARQLVINEAELLKSFPDFANFPADAQMAIHGMAWAMGSAFVPRLGFKQFQTAANAGNWTAAKAQSGFKLEAPQRKAAQDLMFDNAAKVVQYGLNPDILYYPGQAPISAPTGGGMLGPLLATVAIGGLLGTGYIYRDRLPALAHRAIDTTRAAPRAVLRLAKRVGSDAKEAAGNNIASLMPKSKA